MMTILNVFYALNPASFAVMTLGRNLRAFLPLLALMLLFTTNLSAQSQAPKCKKCWQELLSKFEPLELDKPYHYHKLSQAKELPEFDAKEILNIFEKKPEKIQALGRLDFSGKQKMMILFFTFEQETSLGRKAYLELRTMNAKGEIYANKTLLEFYISGEYAQADKTHQGFTATKEGDNYRIKYKEKESMLIAPSGRQQF